MKRNCPVAAASPALKSVSSVRQTELPTPAVCAAAETSEWNPEATVMVRDVVLVVAAFHTCRVTLYVPAVKYECAALCAADVAPSPNHQNHCVGEPVERSVKVAASPTLGDAGATSKAAVTGGAAGAGAATVTVRLVCDCCPLLPDTLRVT